MSKAKTSKGSEAGSAPVLLLDTFSLFFRAYYALPEMSTRGGEPTSAVYGFSVLLLKLLRENRGAALAFALDAPTATFRHQSFEAYKAKREPAPPPLASQFGKLESLLECLAVPTFRAPGYEADDLLASLAKRARDSKQSALVVSGDRDLLQLAHGSIRVHFVGRRGKDATTYDEAAVIDRFGVPPCCLPAYVGLVGDTSDNLPGVPGIGASTAKKLLHGRTSCRELFDALESVEPARVRELLLTHRDQVLQTEELARLREDVPLLLEGVCWRAPAAPSLRALRGLFEQLEFRSLLTRLDQLLAV